MTGSPQHFDRLRLRHLRLLELIEEHRSLRAIGTVLNLTQPAVSQMLKDLEHAFGVEFVERSARGVLLTAAGKLAMERARAGLASFDHLADELQANRPPVVRIGTNPAVMFQLLPVAISILEARKTNVHFKVNAGVVSDMLYEVWNGNLDCFVGRVDWDQIEPGVSEFLRYDPLTMTELVLACSQTHPLAGRTDLTPAELLNWSWALSTKRSNNRIALDTAFRNLGLPGPVPTVEMEADPNALTLLASRVPFITCVPSFVFDAQIGTESLCALDVPGLALPPIRIGFVYLAHNKDLAPLQALRQALIEAVQ